MVTLSDRIRLAANVAFYPDGDPQTWNDARRELHNVATQVLRLERMVDGIVADSMESATNIAIFLPPGPGVSRRVPITVGAPDAAVSTGAWQTSSTP